MTDFPVEFRFDMKQARLLRAASYFAVFAFFAIPLVAGVMGEPTHLVALAVVVALIFTVLGGIFYIGFIGPCFHTGCALVLYEDRLRVAEPNGMLEIPRGAVRYILGPGEQYHSPDDVGPIHVPTGHAPTSPVIVVTDEYKLRGGLWVKEYPRVAVWPVVDATPYDMLAALKAWHANEAPTGAK